MNYKNIYNTIIESAKFRKKFQGSERHHIIPRSCGGSNDLDNLVYLTAREHFICHRLLVKIYKDDLIFKKKMIYALWWMCKTSRQKNVIVSSRIYEQTRYEYNQSHPNKDEARKIKFKENLLAGKYKIDYSEMGKKNKNYIKTLTKEQLLERMKNSALKCDQEKRAHSIRRGKASQYSLSRTDGSVVLFMSYDNIDLITGYTYNQIKYRLKKYNGVLPDGSKIQCLKRYEGNDCNVGRKRKRNNNI
jgi:HNH endonuclease